MFTAPEQPFFLFRDENDEIAGFIPSFALDFIRKMCYFTSITELPMR